MKKERGLNGTSATTVIRDDEMNAVDTTGETLLEAEHIRKDFPLRGGGFMGLGPQRAVHAVDDASLTLRAGHATALVGESGSGKTTVARVLAGMYSPTSGSLRYHGMPIRARNERKLRAYRRHVQLIFQDPFSSLNPAHTVGYHLSRPLHVHGHVHEQAEEREAILSLLRRVSLQPAEQFIEKFPHQLSGGQRQRVAIARALAVQPEILLADEPVSMLDVSIRLDVLNLLLRLKTEEHLGILFITHDIASARYFAEETLVMYAGQMVEGGPSDEVIQRPKHPYTQLLLSAAPDPDRMRAKRKTLQVNSTPVARGEPPSLINPPQGCRFHLRCPHVMPVCSQHFPARTELGGGHWTHCFLFGDESAARTETPAPKPLNP